MGVALFFFFKYIYLFLKSYVGLIVIMEEWFYIHNAYLNVSLPYTRSTHHSYFRSDSMLLKTFTRCVHPHRHFHEVMPNSVLCIFSLFLEACFLY